jgi:hypothetical protein
MTGCRCSAETRSCFIATLLLLAAATAAHAQTPRPAPPYLQANAQVISVGVTFPETAIRQILPPGVRNRSSRRRPGPPATPERNQPWNGSLE